VLIITAKYVTKEELAFLQHNHVYQLIQKGNISRKELANSVANMLVSPAQQQGSVQRKRRLLPKAAKATILIVEDNPDNMKTVKALLQANYRLIEATDGIMGIEQTKKLKPDLVLLDISLPLKNGFQVLDEIRQDPGTVDTPIIALTASAMPDERANILSHGFDAYVPKPIDADLLDKIIRETIYVG
jgi:CheY-like chemotaxis protein